MHRCEKGGDIVWRKNSLYTEGLSDEKEVRNSGEPNVGGGGKAFRGWGEASEWSR